MFDRSLEEIALEAVAVRSLVQRMNVPHKEEALLKMGDNVALSIKESCGPRPLVSEQEDV
jgi:hypothetical protein